MNIENLKNMPLMGQPAETSQIAKLGVAIKAAAAKVSAFGDTQEELLTDSAAAELKSVEAEYTRINDEFEQIFSDDADEFTKQHQTGKDAFDAAVAAAESNDDAPINSIAEALARLNAVDTELDASLVTFLSDEQANFNAIKAKYGELAAIGDAIALI